MSKLPAIFEDFEKAVVRLEEVLKEPKTTTNRDSAIKRFELAFDLTWKTIKTFLQEEKGIICLSPKDCFREAFKQGLVEYDDYWISIVDLRNETIHTYQEELAEKVYSQLSEILNNFQKVLRALKAQNTQTKL